MSNKKTFSIGGIHLNKRKISALSPIQTAPLPEIIYIPVKQHIGAPAVFKVSKGDKVKIGTLLAEADGIISANVHSSAAGEVIKIDDMPDSNGYPESVIVIKTAPDDYEAEIDLSPDINRNITQTQEEIVEAIRKAGIVGMGGAGFPTPVKTSIPENKKADYLIVNGIECEPYLTADGALMLEKAEQIIIGAKILNKALGIQNAIIAIDENKPQAIEKLTKITKSYIGVNVLVCKSIYPQGGERQLINAVTGREVPSGKLPIDVGCIVQNVATVYAVYEAVMKHKPLYERVLTVSGDKSLTTPGNYLVRIGTPAEFILDLAATHKPQIGKLLFGGPMMGTAAASLQTPITKLTAGLLILPETAAIKPEETNCIRCGKCAEICPVGLQPYAFAADLKRNDNSRLKQLHVMDCIECGSCAYSCPAKIPLLDYCKLGKYELKKQKQGN